MTIRFRAASESHLRRQPGDKAPSQVVVREGTRLTATAHRDGWFKVVDDTAVAEVSGPLALLGRESVGRQLELRCLRDATLSHASVTPESAPRPR